MLFFKQKIFSKSDEQLIVKAIEHAERGTSGEIRVHVDSSDVKHPLDKAQEVFASLHMHETKERNGILFYVNPKQHVFAVWGDEGIHKQLPDGFWDDISELVIVLFKEERFGEGLEQAILKCGEKLQEFFPVRPDDRNELSNDITYS